MSDISVKIRKESQVLERRRPGRIAAAELLIPLLRNTTSAGQALADDAPAHFPDHDTSAGLARSGFFRGLTFALPASLIMWVLILGGIWIVGR